MPKFEREVEIRAPVEKVWQVMTEPNHWSQWFPGVDSVTNVGPVSPGATLNWASEGRTGQARIVNMEPMKRLEVTTQVGNDQDSHVFVLQPGGGFLGLGADECKVVYTLDTLMGGGILATFVAGGNPKDELRVKNAMDHLKKLVEGP